jgi:hypothetical protein
VPAYFPAPIVERAWAAGFFDGEGSTVLMHRVPKRPRDYPTPRMVVTQHGATEDDTSVPITLVRFHAAVEGIGVINGPHDYRGQGLYRRIRWAWATTRTDQPAAVLDLLAPFLSQVKLDQAAEVMAAYAESAATRRSYTRREV